MPREGLIYLMYHEIELQGRALCQDEPGYLRYVVTEPAFRAQLERLRKTRRRGISVSEALESGNAGDAGVAITFDDGCETDWRAAAPLLQDFGFQATFYIVAGFLGRRAYLTPEQLRRLSDSGFEVGCHSMTHAYLTGLRRPGLRSEIAESKNKLEQVIGRRVEHFSCPGGRWDHRVRETCFEAGYRSVATSRIGINSATTDRFRLARVAVERGIPLARFDAICRGQGLWLAQTRQAFLDAAKRLAGNSRYERIRSWMLRF